MRAAVFVALLTAVVSLFSARARADILIEPRIGYNFDAFEAQTAAGALKMSAGGPTVGLRLGFAIPVLSFSVIGDYGNLNTSVSSQPAGTSYEGGGETRTSLYAVLGIKIPFLQIYGGYGIIDDWKFKSPSMGAGDTTFHGPGAIKIGLGFTGLPIVALNLEYTMTTFNKYSDTADHDINSNNTYTSAKGSSIMAVLSLPFQF